MPLAAGTRLGVFEILAPLGKGGMGEVYRAKDTKLEREVAVKILPEEMAKRPDRMARFEREAKLLAALDHPHIAAIHGLHEEDGHHFLVMELVDGDTLADRLKRGPLPVPDALELGRQIAEALEAAHEKDIIHRDLKPSNVMLTSKGRAKVLDFGLGRVLEREAFVSSIKTETTPDETGTGVVVGTAPYMSPEQARGEDVNQRTDIWAFGCVLFEMLSGQRAFPGSTASDAIAAVLEHEPEWEALPEAASLIARSVLKPCLRKNKARRIHDIADVRIEIEEALAEPVSSSSTTVPLPGKPTFRRRIAYWAAGFLAVASTAIIVWTLSRPEPIPHVPQRLSIVPSRKAPIVGLGSRRRVALSPDGSQVVYVAVVGGRNQLYMRHIGQLEATPIPGTDGARMSYPFFSPDGEWVGFQRERKLQKVSLQGGQPTTLCETPADLRGASWGEDGMILFPAAADLVRVSEDGGTPEVVSTHPEGKTGIYRHPQILPGGEAAVVTIQAESNRHDECNIGVLSLKTGAVRVLFQGGTFARYLPSGHLIYTRYGSLLAVPFDLRRLEVTGKPVQVLEDVAMYINGTAHLAVSRSGSLAYVPRPYGPRNRSLVWADRRGRIEPVTEERRAYEAPFVSPDGTRIAVTFDRPDGSDIWVRNLRQGTWKRLTFEKGNLVSVWSPDGRRLAFHSDRRGPRSLFGVPADRSRPPEPLLVSPHFDQVNDWSPDGRSLLFQRQDVATHHDLWVLPLQEGGRARPYLVAPDAQIWGRFSPNGRFVVYASNDSGRWEIYVSSFPDAVKRWTVSSAGGKLPLWSPDGREIFFRSLGDKRVMVAAVQMEPTFGVEPPEPLFEIEHRISWIWDVTPDGKRFVMVLEDEEEPDPAQIVVIPNFAEELKARMAGAGR